MKRKLGTKKNRSTFKKKCHAHEVEDIRDEEDGDGIDQAESELPMYDDEEGKLVSKCSYILNVLATTCRN